MLQDIHHIVSLVNRINEETDAHVTITISKHCPLSVYAYYITPQNEEEFMNTEYCIYKSFYHEITEEELGNLWDELIDLLKKKLKEAKDEPVSEDCGNQKGC